MDEKKNIPQNLIGLDQTIRHLESKLLRSGLNRKELDFLDRKKKELEHFLSIEGLNQQELIQTEQSQIKQTQPEQINSKNPLMEPYFQAFLNGATPEELEKLMDGMPKEDKIHLLWMNRELNRIHTPPTKTEKIVWPIIGGVGYILIWWIIIPILFFGGLWLLWILLLSPIVPIFNRF